MKTRILIFAALLLLGFAASGSRDAASPASEQEPVKIYITPGMGNLAESWINAYTKINPNLNFEINQVSLAELKTEMTDDNSVGFAMQRPNAGMVAESMWHLTLGREVVVPVVNASNPYIEMLKNKGLTTKKLAELVSRKNPTWGNSLSGNSDQPVRFVLENDPELLMAVSRFLEVDPAVIGSVKSGENFSAMISKDIYAIGFCRLATITDAEKQEFKSNIVPLPLDRNGNGQIDHNENIFIGLDQLERAVWMGKYPQSLVYNIFALAPDQPKDPAVNGLLSWIVTSGQSAVVENGFTDLAYYERQSDLDKLNPAVALATEEVPRSFSTATILLIAFLVVLTTVVILLAWNSRRKASKLLYDNGEINRFLRPESIDIPNGLFYDKSHTWAFMEKDGTVKVGIDDFLQHVTGDYTGLIMKNPNDMIRRNDIAATLVHEGKKLNIYAPVTGRIVQRNEDLVDYPSLANNSPYSWGWIYEIEPSNWIREIGFLKMADQYRDWIRKEFIRLKDFVIGACQQKVHEGELVLQEGGELPDHVLHDFEPDIWEEFQLRFLDNSDIN